MAGEELQEIDEDSLEKKKPFQMPFYQPDDNAYTPHPPLRTSQLYIAHKVHQRIAFLSWDPRKTLERILV